MKLWKGLTHQRPLEYPKDETAQIRQMCNIFMENNRLAALLLQFPWSFRCTSENLQYLDRLLVGFSDYPRAVEIRHSSWNCPEYLDLLREHGAAFCNIDQPALRDCLPPTSIVTAPFAYLRLHGRNAPAWFRENTQPHERYNYFYDESEIDELNEIAQALERQSHHVLVIGNNHFRGQAAAGVLMMQGKLEGQVPAMPAPLLKAFPLLARIQAQTIHGGSSDQPDLFAGQ